MYRNLNAFEFKFFYLNIFLKLLLSAAFLDIFINYSKQGGVLLEKLHPASYFIILLTFNLILKRKANLISFKNKPVLIALYLYLASLIIIMMYFLISKGTSNLAYLVETFLTAGLSILIILFMDIENKNKLINMILTFVFINSLISLFEFAFKFHLLSYMFQVPIKYYEFRSHALLGHPLNNALITSFSIFFVFSTRWRLIKKIFFSAICICAILAYGARSAAISVGIGYCLMLIYFFKINYKKKQLYFHIFLILWGIPFILIISYMLIIFTGMGTRLFSQELLDSSGMARLSLFKVFNYLSYSDLLYGLEQQEYLDIVKPFDVPVIENFWIEFILQFGAILGVPFLLLMLYLIYVLQKNEPYYLKVSCFVFLLTASSNNSLTTKTAALAIFLTLLSISIKKNILIYKELSDKDSIRQNYNITINIQKEKK